MESGKNEIRTEECYYSQSKKTLQRISFLHDCENHFCVIVSNFRRKNFGLFFTSILVCEDEVAELDLFDVMINFHQFQ